MTQLIKLKESLNNNKQKLKYIKHRFYPQLTYAQHSEDLVIKELLGIVNNFIDIGANDGFSCSNSFLFALAGASGLMFEPVASVFNKLSGLYSLNKQIKCINEGISDGQKSVEIMSDNLLSYIPETQDLEHKKMLSQYFSKDAIMEKIKVNSLSYWMNKYPIFTQVDFVSVDVEGHELSVIKGIDFSQFKTRCFIIETHAYEQSSTWLHQDYEAINNILVKNNYCAVLKSKHNTFWLHVKELDKSKFKNIKNNFCDYEMINFN